MEKQVINVEGMSCEHCINAITKAVKALNGINSVNVSLKEKTVTVEYDNMKVSLDKIKAEIEDQGYDIV
jgi:copper chaperone